MWSKPLKLAIAFIFFNFSSLAQNFYEYEKPLILSDCFYYILNAKEKIIYLKFNGIELFKYKIEEINLVVPKIFFLKLNPKILPSIFYINNATVEPPVYLLRPNLNPQAKKEEKAQIPPTLEELIRVPKDFYIKGKENYKIYVSLKKEANFPLKISFFQKIKKRFSSFFKAVTLKKEPALFLKMENEEGEKFYRSFQENSYFLVILNSKE